MRTIVKELLDEMLSITILPDKVLLKKAFDKMGVQEALTVPEGILFWQKALYNPKLPKFKDMKHNELIISEVDRKRFKDFYKYSPLLAELFVLEEDEIHYNPNLSKKEITEMQVYIDQHYKVPFHVRGQGTIYY